PEPAPPAGTSPTARRSRLGASEAYRTTSNVPRPGNHISSFDAKPYISPDVMLRATVSVWPELARYDTTHTPWETVNAEYCFSTAAWPCCGPVRTRQDTVPSSRNSCSCVTPAVGPSVQVQRN